jgi:hypothetical protein
MSGEHPELDDLRPPTRVRWTLGSLQFEEEEELASAADHSVIEVDQWRTRHFIEEDMRNAAKAAKKKYEDALRAKFFRLSVIPPAPYSVKRIIAK